MGEKKGTKYMEVECILELLVPLVFHDSVQGQCSPTSYNNIKKIKIVYKKWLRHLLRL